MNIATLSVHNPAKISLPGHIDSSEIPETCIFKYSAMFSGSLDVSTSCQHSSIVRQRELQCTHVFHVPLHKVTVAAIHGVWT